MKVAPGASTGLVFPLGNSDKNIFSSPDEVKLDRRPNPHVAFGFGPHLCLGAAHVRLVVRTLMDTLCDKVARIQIFEHT